MKMLVDHPLVFDPSASNFHSYFELRFAPFDILADLGYTLKCDYLKLPQPSLPTIANL